MNVTRKSIFMTGLRNKVSYVFTNKDLKEVETIIDFYEKQLKQRDEVIDEAIKKCELEISASSYQYDKSYKQQDLCYKVAHERILGILQKYKGDNNE